MLSPKNGTDYVQIARRRVKTEEKLFSKCKQADKEKCQGNKTRTRLSIATFLSDLKKLIKLQRCSLSILWVWENVHWWAVRCDRSGWPGWGFSCLWLDWLLTNLYFLCLLFSNKFKCLLSELFPFVVAFCDFFFFFPCPVSGYLQNNMVILFPVSFLEKDMLFQLDINNSLLGRILNSITAFTSLRVYFHFVTRVGSFTGNWWDPINNNLCLNS